MIVERSVDANGYAVLELGGVVHRLQVFTTDIPGKRPLRHPLMVEISGLGNAVAALDQEDIDALHEFLGRFATKEKDDG